ncbi:hypothetical protein [Sutcliffiella sp. NC1]|uniref:hypothetical protein n=1 Tax=Sutcliffiella sp. NC1 TaxID=3004096 RepID=UPI0022DD7880|nr:hypothetical protein [Sutcliffiella sp. NC1]WBL16465.1 hypothetical protein O1A01_07490 [Sutcliffiella sp. NC1]
MKKKIGFMVILALLVGIFIADTTLADNNIEDYEKLQKTISAQLENYDEFKNAKVEISENGNISISGTEKVDAEKLMKTVDNIVANYGNEDKYQTMSGTYHYYIKNGSYSHAHAAVSLGLNFRRTLTRVYYENIHGGVLAEWRGSGTARFIRNDSTVELRVASGNIDITWPPVFTHKVSSTERSMPGELKYGENSHMTIFNNLNADSRYGLDGVIHVGSTLIRGSDGHDYRTYATARH